MSDHLALTSGRERMPLKDPLEPYFEFYREHHAE